MSRQTRISIALAVYNGERFIREQLDSFVRQTRLPHELVVSDNASNDRSVEIVREFATRAPFPVRLYLNPENVGVGKNFEQAISECSGDVIFLADCDDVWYPEKLFLMEDVLDRFPRAGIVACDADLVDESLRSMGITLWKARGFALRRRIQKRLAEGKVLNHWAFVNGNCMAFRAKLKPLVLPIPDGGSFVQYGHDSFITWSITYSGAGGVVFVPRPLMAYRQHANQMCGVSSRTFCSRFVDRLRSWNQSPRAMLVPLIERLEQAIALAHSHDSCQRAAAVSHWRARSTMPPRRTVRIPIVARELLTLRYHRFSNGLLTAAKDLFRAHETSTENSNWCRSHFNSHL
jgi:glycosyltransferase involved in cell wall biosynthesis